MDKLFEAFTMFKDVFNNVSVEERRKNPLITLFETCKTVRQNSLAELDSSDETI
jgi:hypothetical protein